MTDVAWIALGSLAFLMLVQLGASIWWAATASADIRTLKEQAKSHGNLGEVVGALRGEVAHLREAVNDWKDVIKDWGGSPAPKRRQPASDT